MKNEYLFEQESMRVLPPVPFIGREVQEDFVYRKLNKWSRGI
jgi:hypothetical protein